MSLIAHWKLNEENTNVPVQVGNTAPYGTFQTLQDSSGNNRHLSVCQFQTIGVYYHGLITVAGPGGEITRGMRSASLGIMAFSPNNYWQMLCFSGVITESGNVTFNTIPCGIPHSVAFWVKAFPHNAGSGYLFNQGVIEFKFAETEVGTIPNSLFIIIRSLEIIYPVPDDGNWHHYALITLPDAASYNDLRFYIDGELVEGYISNPSGLLSFEDGPETVGLFNGLSQFSLTEDALADVRVYDHALSQDEVLDLIALVVGNDGGGGPTNPVCELIANWKLNEPSFTSSQLPVSLADSSGNSRHLSAGQAANSNGYISIPGPTSGTTGVHANKITNSSVVPFYTNENAFANGFPLPITMTFWFKRMGESSTEVFENITSNNNFLQITAFLNTNNLSIRIMPFENMGNIWFNLPYDSDWHSLKIILNNTFSIISNIAVFIDDIEQTPTQTNPGSGFYNPNPTFFSLTLGSGTASTAILALSDICIYNCVLQSDPPSDEPEVVPPEEPGARKTAVRDIRVLLSGGSGNVNPNLSLGSHISNVPVANGNINNLFNSLVFSISDLASPYHDYRCFYIVNNGPTTIYNVTLWVLGESPYNAQIGISNKNEVQRITIEGIPQNGSMVLSYNGNEFTTSVANPATWATQIQTQLNNLNSLSQVQVSAQQTQNQISFEVSFTNYDGSRAHNLIEHVSNNFNLNVIIDAVQKGSPINAVASVIVNGTATPTNVTFFNNLVLPRLSPGDKVPIWVKRIISQQNLGKNRFVIRCQADSSIIGQTSNPEPPPPQSNLIIGRGGLKLSGLAIAIKAGIGGIIFSGSATNAKIGVGGLFLGGQTVTEFNYGYCCCVENITVFEIVVSGVSSESGCTLCSNLNGNYSGSMNDTSNDVNVCLLTGVDSRCEEVHVICEESNYDITILKQATVSIEISPCPDGVGDPPVITLDPFISIGLGLCTDCTESQECTSLGGGNYRLAEPIVLMADQAPYDCINLLSGTYELIEDNSTECNMPPTIDVDFSGNNNPDDVNVYHEIGIGGITINGVEPTINFYNLIGNVKIKYNGVAKITSVTQIIGNGFLNLGGNLSIADIDIDGAGLELNGLSLTNQIFNIRSISGRARLGGNNKAITFQNFVGTGGIILNGYFEDQFGGLLFSGNAIVIQLDGGGGEPDECGNCEFEVTFGDYSCFCSLPVTVECTDCPSNRFYYKTKSDCDAIEIGGSLWELQSCGTTFTIDISDGGYLILVPEFCGGTTCVQLPFCECPLTILWNNLGGNEFPSFENAEGCFFREEAPNDDCGQWDYETQYPLGTYGTGYFYFTVAKGDCEAEIELIEFSWVVAGNGNGGWCEYMDEPIRIDNVDGSVTFIRCGGFVGNIQTTGEDWVSGFHVISLNIGVRLVGSDGVCEKWETIQIHAQYDNYPLPDD